MDICTVKHVIGALDRIAPELLAQDWDHVGLQCGSLSMPVFRGMVALEVTAEVLDEAEKNNIDMLVVHHPLIFRPLDALREDCWASSLAVRCVKMGLSVYAMHTNLDLAPNGVNRALARALLIENAAELKPDGIGLWGHIRPTTLEEFAGFVQRALGGCVRCLGDPKRRIRRVAVCGGKGYKECIQTAPRFADVLVTSDIDHHQAQDARVMGFALIDAGHFETEHPIAEFITHALQNDNDMVSYKVKWCRSQEGRSPWNRYIVD